MATFRNPCHARVRIHPYGDPLLLQIPQELLEPKELRRAFNLGHAIPPGSSIQLMFPFSDYVDEGPMIPPKVRGVHVEPSGVDFTVDGGAITEAGGYFSYPQYDVAIPVRACPRLADEK